MSQPLKNIDLNTATGNIFFDEAAFEAFFKKNFLSLVAHCQFKYAFTTEVAKDVVHSAFEKLWQHRKIITTDFAVLAYLYKIITNNSLDILKHEKVKKHYADGLPGNDAMPGSVQFEKVEYKQLMQDISRIVFQFPPQMRRVFELCKYEGLKYSEAAVELNISIKTVEIQMGKALAKLRLELANYFTVLLWAVLAMAVGQ